MYLVSFQTIPQSRFLTRQDTHWKWEQEEQKAVEELKEALVGDEVMSYFNPQKQTEIIVDASPVGLGGLLVQEGKVLGYASPALSEYVEGRRPRPSERCQTEREMLASVGSRTFPSLCLWSSVCHYH